MALLVSGLSLGTTATSFADKTPAPSSSSSVYQAELAAYKVALTQYNVTRITNDINYRAAMAKYWADWKITLQNFNASWQATLSAYQTARAAYDAKIDAAQSAHKVAVDAIDSTFLAAIAGTPSNDALIAAMKTYWSALSAQNISFKTAVAALGAAPVRPVRPSEPAKPVAPLKPTDPTKPVAPEKRK